MSCPSEVALRDGEQGVIGEGYVPSVALFLASLVEHLSSMWGDTWKKLP